MIIGQTKGQATMSERDLRNICRDETVGSFLATSAWHAFDQLIFGFLQVLLKIVKPEIFLHST